MNKKVFFCVILGIIIILSYLFFESTIQKINMTINFCLSKIGMRKINFQKAEFEIKKLFGSDIKLPLENMQLRILKSKRILELYNNGKLIKTYKIALGKESAGAKEIERDNKTPEGIYYICTRNSKSKFDLFLGLNYPNKSDAEKAFQKKCITKDIRQNIMEAEEKKECPPWNTSLGGSVGIHGGGNKPDWTAGCIALNDEDIVEIWMMSKKWTKVTIEK